MGKDVEDRDNAVKPTSEPAEIGGVPEGFAVIRPQGRLDLNGVGNLDALLAEAAARNPRCIVDLSLVVFLSSVGIRALIHAARDLRAKGGGMVLLSPMQDVEKVLMVSGIAGLIPLARDLAEAIAMAGS